MNYRTVYKQHGGTRPMSKTHDSKLYLKNRTWMMSLIPTDTSLPLIRPAAQGKTYMNGFM